MVPRGARGQRLQPLPGLTPTMIHPPARVVAGPGGIFFIILAGLSIGKRAISPSGHGRKSRFSQWTGRGRKIWPPPRFDRNPRRLTPRDAPRWSTVHGGDLCTGDGEAAPALIESPAAQRHPRTRQRHPRRREVVPVEDAACIVELLTAIVGLLAAVAAAIPEVRRCARENRKGRKRKR